MVQRGGTDAHENVRRPVELRFREVRSQRNVLDAAVGRQREPFQSAGPLAVSIYSGCSLTHDPSRSPMISIKVPQLGESIVEATVARWLKKEGDAVAAGETLVELETDKITVEVPALKGGVLTKRLKAEGDVVKLDELLGELDETAVPAAAGA